MATSISRTHVDGYQRTTRSPGASMSSDVSHSLRGNGRTPRAPAHGLDRTAILVIRSESVRREPGRDRVQEACAACASRLHVWSNPRATVPKRALFDQSGRAQPRATEASHVPTRRGASGARPRPLSPWMPRAAPDASEGAGGVGSAGERGRDPLYEPCGARCEASGAPKEHATRAAASSGGPRREPEESTPPAPEPAPHTALTPAAKRVRSRAE